MKKEFLIKSLSDGIVQYLSYEVLLWICFSKFTANVSLEIFVGVAGLMAVAFAIIYYILYKKESDNKKIFLLSAGSCVGVLLCMVLTFIIRLIVLFALPNMRELNNADGISMMLLGGVFFIGVSVLRLCIFIVFVIKNIYKRSLSK